ncbi:MAG TPA: Rv3654c family TadE-like protein [Actinomycetota bacterium]
MAQATERGAISIVAATGSLVLCLTGLAAVDVGSMLHARASAQNAADAAALAAAVAQVEILRQDADPLEEATLYAEANGARLVRCSCEPGSPTAEVEVSVRPQLLLLRGWDGRLVRAVARAEVDPDLLSYHDNA